MKRHAPLVGLAFLGLGACSSETVARPPPAPVNWQSLQAPRVVDAGPDVVTEKERALPEAYAAALAAAGFAPLGALLDEDAHFGGPGLEDAHGRGPTVRAHELLLGAFDDRKVALTRIWRTPNEQTIEWTLSATQGHDWMGVPATHKAVVLKGLTLLTTRDDGSVTDVRFYLDTAVAKAQLGVGPKDLLALPVPAAPTGKPQIVEATGSESEKAGVAAVRAQLDALENNNEADYLAAMSDDVEVHTLERSSPARGKADAKAYYRNIHKEVGQLDTTVLNAWGAGSFAIVEYLLAGEQLGPIGWIPAQRDKVIRFAIVDVCEIAGGKVVRVWRYDNPAEVVGSMLP